MLSSWVSLAAELGDSLVCEIGMRLMGWGRGWVMGLRRVVGSGVK